MGSEGSPRTDSVWSQLGIYWRVDHFTHLSGIAVPTSKTFCGEKGRGERVVIDVDGLTVLSASSALGKSYQYQPLGRDREHTVLCTFFGVCHQTCCCWNGNRVSLEAKVEWLETHPAQNRQLQARSGQRRRRVRLPSWKAVVGREKVKQRSPLALKWTSITMGGVWRQFAPLLVLPSWLPMAGKQPTPWYRPPGINTAVRCHTFPCAPRRPLL